MRDQQQANAPWVGGGGFGNYGGKGGGHFGGQASGGGNFGNTGGMYASNRPQDRMTVMLADVVDCRADRNLLLNMDEDVTMVTVALQRSLFDEDIGIRMRKHGIFPVFMTSSGSVIDDIEKSWKIASSVGLNLRQHQFDQLVNGMQELSRKIKLKDIYAENFSAVWGRFVSGDIC